MTINTLFIDSLSFDGKPKLHFAIVNNEQNRKCWFVAGVGGVFGF